MSDIRQIPLGDKDAQRAAVEQLRRELPNFIELAVLTAKLRKASFDAHIAAGFTPEQALSLCANPCDLS